MNNNIELEIIQLRNEYIEYYNINDYNYDLYDIYIQNTINHVNDTIYDIYILNNIHKKILFLDIIINNSISDIINIFTIYDNVIKTLFNYDINNNITNNNITNNNDINIVINNKYTFFHAILSYINTKLLINENIQYIDVIYNLFHDIIVHYGISFKELEDYYINIDASYYLNRNNIIMQHIYNNKYNYYSNPTHIIKSYNCLILDLILDRTIHINNNYVALFTTLLDKCDYNPYDIALRIIITKIIDYNNLQLLQIIINKYPIINFNKIIQYYKQHYDLNEVINENINNNYHKHDFMELTFNTINTLKRHNFIFDDSKVIEKYSELIRYRNIITDNLLFIISNNILNKRYSDNRLFRQYIDEHICDFLINLHKLKYNNINDLFISDTYAIYLNNLIILYETFLSN